MSVVRKVNQKKGKRRGDTWLLRTCCKLSCHGNLLSHILKSDVLFVSGRRSDLMKKKNCKNCVCLASSFSSSGPLYIEREG